MSLKLKYWLLATAIMVLAIVLTWLMINGVYKNLLKRNIEDALLQETEVLALVYSKMLDSQIGVNSFEIITELTSSSGYGYYYVIDSSGKVLFHSDKTKENTNLKDMGLGNLLKEIIDKKFGTYEYSYDSNKIFSTFSKLQNKNLYLIHAIKESKIIHIDTKSKILLLMILVSISGVLSLLIYLFVGYILSPLIKQTSNIREFVANVSTSVMENSSAAVEVKNITENTKGSYDNLDSLIQDFAASIEEAQAETKSMFENLRSFMSNISTMTEKSMQIAKFTDSLNELNERITELSDTIAVLAINATVETSREKIDREGLNRISELITTVAANSRKMAKESRKLLNEIKNSISESVLASERISKDTKTTEESLESIKDVLNSFVGNVDKLTKLSYNLKYSMEEVLSGVEQLMDSIDDISKNIEKLSERFKEIKL